MLHFVIRTSLVVVGYLDRFVKELAVGAGPLRGGCATANPQLSFLGLNELANPLGHRNPGEDDVLVKGRKEAQR